jgi:signal peptidase II
VLGKYRLLVVVAVLAAGVDQGSKALALALLEEEEVVPVIGEVIDVRLRQNTGVAWGLGAGLGQWGRRVLFPAVGVGVGLLLLGLYRGLREEERLLRVATALIIGGGLGNLADRLRLGHVVDFIAVHVGGDGRGMSGTFNLADAALVVGVVFVVVGVLFRRRQVQEAPEEGSE